VILAKSKKVKRKELTIRTADEKLLGRLDWIELKRKDLPTRNAALLEALRSWLEKMESIHGTEPVGIPTKKSFTKASWCSFRVDAADLYSG